ncbi:uncharacterized protein isoform X4 [Musca autumnalis]
MWKIFVISVCIFLGSVDSKASRSTSKRQTEDYDFGFGSYAPDFGFIDPLAFHQQLTQQILAQQAAQQQAIYRQQQALFDYARRQSQYNGKGNRYAPNYSAAAASIGPGGAYQTAFINPGNPAVPNVSNRFSSTSPGGYKGVSVSSYSTSSDVNGKRTSMRGAQTTINDNGKITTYKVHS